MPPYESEQDVTQVTELDDCSGIEVRGAQHAIDVSTEGHPLSAEIHFFVGEMIRRKTSGAEDLKDECGA